METINQSAQDLALGKLGFQIISSPSFLLTPDPLLCLVLRASLQKLSL